MPQDELLLSDLGYRVISLLGVKLAHPSTYEVGLCRHMFISTQLNIIKKDKWISNEKLKCLFRNRLLNTHGLKGLIQKMHN